MALSTLNDGKVHFFGNLDKLPKITKLKGVIKGNKKFVALIQRVRNDNEFEDIACLPDFYLVFWREDPNTKKKRSDGIKLVPLYGHYHAHQYPEYEEKFKNVIALNAERLYFLVADNETAMNSWVEMLNWTFENIKNNCVPDTRAEENKDVSSEEIMLRQFNDVLYGTRRQRGKWTLPSWSSGRTNDSDSGIGRSSISSKRKNSLTYGSCPSLSGYSDVSDYSSTSSRRFQLSNTDRSTKSRPAYPNPPVQDTDDNYTTYNNDKLCLPHSSKTDPPSIVNRRTIKDTKRSNTLATSNIRKSALPAIYELVKHQQESNTSSQYVGNENPEYEDTSQESIYADVQEKNEMQQPYDYTTQANKRLLTLFDKTIELPIQSEANVTKTSMVIRYGQFEIILRENSSKD